MSTATADITETVKAHRFYRARGAALARCRKLPTSHIMKSLLVTLVFAAAATVAPAQLVNPSFETGNFSGWTVASTSTTRLDMTPQVIRSTRVLQSLWT